MSKKKHEIPEELLAGLLANYQKPEDLISEEGLLKHLTKLVVERALEAEMTSSLDRDSRHGLRRRLHRPVSRRLPLSACLTCNR